MEMVQYLWGLFVSDFLGAESENFDAEGRKHSGKTTFVDDKEIETLILQHDEMTFLLQRKKIKSNKNKMKIKYK